MRSMGAQVTSKDTKAMIAPTGHDMVKTRVALYQVFGDAIVGPDYIQHVAQIWDEDQNWDKRDREPSGADLGLNQIRTREP